MRGLLRQSRGNVICSGTNRLLGGNDLHARFITLLRSEQTFQMNSTHHITKLLHDWNNGDAEALNRLIPLADSELKKIARKYMSKERAGHLFEPTDLVEEAWLKLLREKNEVGWKNRRHFYSLLARRMRQILYDYVDKNPKVEFI